MSPIIVVLGILGVVAVVRILTSKDDHEGEERTTHATGRCDWLRSN